MPKKDNTFTIKFEKFYQGFAPLAHLNTLTETGNSGHSSAMVNCDVLGEDITQGSGLANLTNGTQAGAVTELINFILDKAVSADATYGIGATKLFKISSTAVTNAGIWPHTITNATDGESCIDMDGDLYYFYNKSSGGDIGLFDLSSTFDDDWGSTVPATGAAAIAKAPHPSATKEDIILFGNGQYVGTYIKGTDTLAPTKLDFKEGNEVADVIFSGNQWLIAVNGGTSGTNRNQGRIYIYDGGALSSVLSDETGVGFQKIGFLFEDNGIVFIAYQDLSSTGGYKIGYLAGRQIKTLGYFTGSLPNFAQKTLYKNTILFLSNNLIYSAGALTEELPFQVSQHSDGGYATCGAMAAPFGTPMIASTESTNFKLAKFSGFDTTCSWRSIIFPLVQGRNKAMIDEITVLTKALGANARCDLKIESNQAVSSSSANQITTTGQTRHIFRVSIPEVEDFRVFLNWANGNATNDCAIREIHIRGHFVSS